VCDALLSECPPRAPEPQLLHRWLDTRAGLALVVAGVERQGAPVLARARVLTF